MAARFALHGLCRPLANSTLLAKSQAIRLISTTKALQSTLPVAISGTGIGVLQHISVPGKTYSFTADTYPILGGEDSAPSPVVYSLAALSACNQVTGAVVAKDHGIRLGQWHVDVEAQLPTKTLVKGEEGNPNWESVKLKLRVQTDIPEGSAEFEKFVSEVERRCPITALFKRSGVKYESEWVNEKL